MNQILVDWVDLCEGRVDHEDCHFLGLFKVGLEGEDLRQALKYLPSSEEIERRLLDVLKAGTLENYAYLQNPPIVDRAITRAAARAWLDECARFHRSVGNDELMKLNADAEIDFVGKEEFWAVLERDNAVTWIPEELGDEVFMRMPSDTPLSIWAFLEATYGLAANYELGWYVAQPVLHVDIDFEKYFDLWKSGGFGLLTTRGFWILDSELDAG